MSARVGLGVSLMMPLICAALLGCTIVDQYSGRAVVYNLEAEQAEDQAILLNIVRAYLRRPMQFTTVSTITGVASASAGTQYTLPTNIPFRPPTQGATGLAAFPPVPTWLFSGSVSGGPAFTVPVLDTQEFYQGILKAIPGQLWDVYIQAGYPRALLFNLFVQKVVMRRDNELCRESTAKCSAMRHFFPECATNDHTAKCGYFRRVAYNCAATDPTDSCIAAHHLPDCPTDGHSPQCDAARHLKPECGAADGTPRCKNYRQTAHYCPPSDHTIRCEFVFQNYVGNNIQIELFQVLADYLISLGITTERPSPDRVPFDENKTTNVNVRFVGAPGPNNTAQVLSPPGGSGETEAQSPSRPYKLCFAQRTGTNLVGEKSSCGYTPAVSETVTNEIRASGSASVNLIASDALIRRLIGIANQYDPGAATQLEAFFDGTPVSIEITIYMRHTEGMIYYLGELARRELNPEHDSGPIFIKTEPPYRPHDFENDCDAERCGYIFHLREVPAPVPGDFLAVNYEGRWYSVPAASSNDYSTETFEIVKQQIALNSSAKSLPQSSVITTVGGQ